MQHLGDITKISGYAAPVVDAVIGGSPCQDLSIAGRRAGLAGERSGLFMEQIRIIKEMRENDKRSGRTGEFVRPRYMVWENVPGAFSSCGGRDFAAVLAETVRIIEPEAPELPVPDKGWSTSGVLVGDGWSVAWRTLDAQYWGVPQRRRRIALVADFGGCSAPEILFVRESVRGNPTPRGTAGEASAGSAENGAGETVWCLQGNGIDRADTAGCNGKGWKTDVSYTLNTVDRPAVCAGFKLGNSERAFSIGYSEECAPTLNAECGGNKPAVLDMSHACDVIRDCGEIAPSLQARMGTGGNQTPLVAYGIGNGQADGACHPALEKSHALDTMHDAQAVMVAAVDCRNGTENAEINGTLQAKSGGGQSVNLQNVCRIEQTVRRLTPLECERLQGYPDGWTDIGDWIDGKGKKRKTTDSERYKALGNSIALPPWKWVLKRLCANYERNATMASLFDGIGGFPLIWEQINGRGSCLWASEIEPFPIAVTKLRFGE